jgi:polar amino acid transport system permease protein
VNYLQIPLLLTASIWYLVVTSVLSVIQYYIERHFGRGSSSRAAPDSVLARIRRGLLIRHEGTA